MTSVSMTINGPAPMLLAFFMNAAIDQQCEVYIKQNKLEKEIEKKIENDSVETKEQKIGFTRLTYLIEAMMNT